MSNLKQKEEFYSKEYEHLRTRINLLTSNYPGILEKKISKKSKKLMLLEEEKEKINGIYVVDKEEKNYSKEIQIELDIKSFYEKKNKECFENLEKYCKAKKEIQERLEKIQKEYADLKAELLRINKGCNLNNVRSSMVLKKSLDFNEKYSEKVISRLLTKEELLRHDLKKYKIHENSLNNLLSSLDSIVTPRKSQPFSYRSLSQPRINYHRSLHPSKHSNKSFF